MQINRRYLKRMGLSDDEIKRHWEVLRRKRVGKACEHRGVHHGRLEEKVGPGECGKI